MCLARQGIDVVLFEMRPKKQTLVHQSGDFAELVCSNSLKSKKPDSAAGMLKRELSLLGSQVLECALNNQVDAGGALAVNRVEFASDVSRLILESDHIEIRREEVEDLSGLAQGFDALIIATGPMTSDSLAATIEEIVGEQSLAFYDAAAPIVLASSLNMEKVFRQSRYECGDGDYLNAPFSKDEYENFINALVNADKVIKKDFETAELFQACQPIEEIARKGVDAARFGPMKPVGLTDPSIGRRPWAAVQLRAEDAAAQSFNLVGFQTNLTFPEQNRVFRMIPGLENAEFARYGVMHRNTFIDAPKCINENGRAKDGIANKLGIPTYFAGQVSGTEGYCEAIRSGLNCAIGVFFELNEKVAPKLPKASVFGSLMAYASSSDTQNYQPMHVNFGIIEPLQERVKNKRLRYEKYAERGEAAITLYVNELVAAGFKVNDE